MKEFNINKLYLKRKKMEDANSMRMKLECESIKKELERIMDKVKNLENMIQDIWVVDNDPQVSKEHFYTSELDMPSRKKQKTHHTNNR